MKVCLCRVRNPTSFIPVTYMSFALKVFAVNRLLKDFLYVAVFSERYMRTFIPYCPFDVMGINVPAYMAIFLKKDAIFMPQVIAAAEAG